MNIATKDLNGFTAGTELAPLTGLSIQHTRPGVAPAAPSNEDRARAFRNAQPVALANQFHWPFQHSAEAQPTAAGPVALAGECGASRQEAHAGNRRLSLVQAA
jgi:hypothetical protein